MMVRSRWRFVASQRFPAHLHINLAAEYRSIGIGGRLVAAFADQARSLGAPGVHVVTGAASRNVGFYRRQGFVELARSRTSSRDVVCLGQELT